MHTYVLKLKAYGYTLKMIADAWEDGNPHWLKAALQYADDCDLTPR